MKEKKFSDFLAEVKKKNPSLPHREAQTKASELHKAYKLALLHPKGKVADPKDPEKPKEKSKKKVSTDPGPKASEKSQGERNFADFLQEVQEAAPSLSLRDAQKKASELYKAYRAEAKVKASADPGPGTHPGPGPDFYEKIEAPDLARCSVIEGAIRDVVPTTVNSIKGALNNAGIKDYVIHYGERVGPNTQVWATVPGMRVPVEGYFLCFIAR